jgi:excisionase family DNA binding protein
MSQLAILRHVTSNWSSDDASKKQILFVPYKNPIASKFMPKSKNERLLKRREVARLIGVSERTVFRLTADGALPPPVRIGRSVRWSKAKILESISQLSQCQPDAKTSG